jgi:pyruvate dehydrogenase E2 component (dihydrolipoamide acetyltransferase)
VHLGFAVSMRGGGLIAPAVLDAEEKDLDTLMAALRDLTSRVRAGRLRGREMTDATITVTNLGERGVDVVHGVIYPPQVALVGFGTVAQRPWVEDGAFAARPVVSISLAGDHRASDGHLGARFLAEIDDLLKHPEEL